MFSSQETRGSYVAPTSSVPSRGRGGFNLLNKEIIYQNIEIYQWLT